MQIDIALTKPQRRFALTDNPYPAMCGGLGSGKSEAGIIRLILLMLENYSRTRKPCDTLLTFPTYDLCRLRGMPGTEDVLNRLGIPFKTNKSEFKIELMPFGSVLFRSYDHPERIIAFQVAHSIADELDTLPIEKASLVWRKISERTRQKSFRPNSIGAVTTPDHGIHGFVYDKWVKRQQPGYELIKAPTASNPYLPDGYIEQIRANYDERLAELYLNGEFVSLTDSKVYHTFNRIKHNSVRTIQQGDQLHIGLDFNIGGCVAIVFVIAGGNPVAVDEFVSHDTPDVCNKILSRYKGYSVLVYPDASGGSQRTNAAQSDIDLIRAAGLAVQVPSKNPAVRDRVNVVNRLLSQDKLTVNVSKCPELTHALETQGYDKRGEPEKFDHHPAIDDYADSAGYFLHKRFPILTQVSGPQWG